MASVNKNLYAAVFLWVSLLSVGNGEQTCSELNGWCLPITSDIFCSGTRRENVPGCTEKDHYCCVPPAPVSECERLGGECQNILSSKTCDPDLRDFQLCGDDEFEYCCLPDQH